MQDSKTHSNNSSKTYQTAFQLTNSSSKTQIQPKLVTKLLMIHLKVTLLKVKSKSNKMEVRTLIKLDNRMTICNRWTTTCNSNLNFLNKPSKWFKFKCNRFSNSKTSNFNLKKKCKITASNCNNSLFNSICNSKTISKTLLKLSNRKVMDKDRMLLVWLLLILRLNHLSKRKNDHFFCVYVLSYFNLITISNTF